MNQKGISKSLGQPRVHNSMQPFMMMMTVIMIVMIVVMMVVMMVMIVDF